MYAMEQHNIFKCLSTMDSELSKKIASINELKKTTSELRDQLVNAKTSEEIREILKGKEYKITALGETAFKLDRRSDPDFDQWFEMAVDDYYYNETRADELVEESSNSITHDQLTKRNADKVIDVLDEIINKFQRFLTKVSPALDTSSIVSTEKEFLSEKVPKEVAENIASYVSGKEGSIGAQVSQLRVKHGKPGVQGKKGGKKTRKTRKQKKKTRRA
jgi:flagellar biosynthesis chaperone FliJ